MVTELTEVDWVEVDAALGCWLEPLGPKLVGNSLKAAWKAEQLR